MNIYQVKEVLKMLLEFKCSNHRSIKGEVKFSMIAGSIIHLARSRNISGTS